MASEDIPPSVYGRLPEVWTTASHLLPLSSAAPIWNYDLPRKPLHDHPPRPIQCTATIVDYEQSPAMQDWWARRPHFQPVRHVQERVQLARQVDAIRKELKVLERKRRRRFIVWRQFWPAVGGMASVALWFLVPILALPAAAFTAATTALAYTLHD